MIRRRASTIDTQGLRYPDWVLVPVVVVVVLVVVVVCSSVSFISFVHSYIVISTPQSTTLTVSSQSLSIKRSYENRFLDQTYIPSTSSSTSTSSSVRMTAMSSSNEEEGSDDTIIVVPTKNTPTSPVGKVLQQMVIIDGPEWQCVQQQLLRFSSSSSTSSTSSTTMTSTTTTNTMGGIYNVITGSINGKRMVGMQHLLSASSSDDDDNQHDVISLDHDPTIQVYCNSIAYLPTNKEVTEMNAIWTMIQSFSTIHCCRPIMTNIGGGGGNMNFTPSTTKYTENQTRVVIVGNNPFAVQIATILDTVFQYNVTIVATSLPSIVTTKQQPQQPQHTSIGGGSSSSSSSSAGVQYLPPSIEKTVDNDDNDDNESTSTLLGFTSILDQFDIFIDTIGNELSNSIICDNLKNIHNCHTYISTLSESQRIILSNGLFFGPKQSKEHIQQLVTSFTTTTSSSNKKNQQPIYFPAPFGLGTTVETILQKGIVLKPPTQLSNNDNVYVRGWSLKDFWEYTTWPRDATTTNSRFGFPSDVNDDSKRKSQYYNSDFNDDDDEYDDNDDVSTTMISAPPLRSTPGRNMFQTKPENFDSDDNDSSKNNRGLQNTDDRYVMDVSTVNELQFIVQNEISCIVFVSAPFCRTCRYLKPQFVRMARQHRSTTISDEEGSFQFIKAEATGQMSKDIGRALGIDTVPTFILYKNGRRYGTPITSVTRLPSKDLDDTIMAVQQNRTVDFSTLFPTTIDPTSIDDDNRIDRTTKNRSKLS